jgi:hypothetical protein
LPELIRTEARDAAFALIGEARIGSRALPVARAQTHRAVLRWRAAGQAVGSGHPPYGIRVVDGSRVRVAVGYTEVRGRGLVLGPHKSRAPVRTIVAPAAIRPELVEHVREFAQHGLDGLHFHDLLHAGNIWAVQTKVSTKDLMAAGLSARSEASASRPCRTAAKQGGAEASKTQGRRTIADRLSELVDKHRNTDQDNEGGDDDPEDGSAGALAPIG